MLDDIDREAMREGSAISKLPKAGRRTLNYSQLKKGKQEPSLDMLRILNILHGSANEPTRP